MDSQRHHSVSGIFFSEQLCQEVRRLWQELGKDGPNCVADIQRARCEQEENGEKQHWAIHFVPKEIVVSKEISVVQGFPIHISSRDREELQGRVLEIENHDLVASEEIK